MNEKELLKEIEKAAASYDIVFLVLHEAEKVAQLMCSYTEYIHTKKILLLYGDETVYEGPPMVEWKRLDPESCTVLNRLYHTYEFSDKFRVLSRDSRFGGLWNYVETGLLLEKEAFAALLA